MIGKLGIAKNIKETTLASSFTLVIGLLAVFLVTNFDSIFEILLLANLLWYPVVICPLILGLYGLRSKDHVFVITTLITVIGTIIFHISWSHNFALSTIFGAILNTVVFLILHYYICGAYNLKFTSILPHNQQQASTDSWCHKIKIFCHQRLLTSINRSYGSPYIVFGLFVAANYCFPHFMWEDKVEPFYTVSIYLRFFSGVGCIMLLMKDVWMKEQAKYFPLFWHANLIFTLPFLTGFNLWAHDLHLFWLAMMGVVLLLMTSLVDWIRCCLFILIGLLASFILYKSLGGAMDAVHSTNLYTAFYLILAFFTIGHIFIRCKEDHDAYLLYEKDEVITKQKNRLMHMNLKTTEALGVQRRILRNFSHELRNPMSAAVTIADVLSEDDLDSDSRKQASNILNHSLEKFRNYIEDITTVSAAQNQKLPLSTSPTDLTRLVYLAIDVFSSLDHPPKPSISKQV